MRKSDDAVVSHSGVFVDTYPARSPKPETCCNPSPPDARAPTGSAAIPMN
jgi:hypothetical protein